MKISVILLDWGVRESFHSLDYLNNQSAVRSDYELIWVEYFNRKVPALEKHYHTGCLDKYLILGHDPGDYHKHQAWNTGVLAATGDVVVLCDSDVMFRSSFIQSIIDFFASNENCFLFIDEIRSENKSFWPFAYPSWEEVMSAPGLANWNEKYQVTHGLSPEYNDLPLWERMFLRNYGACFCVSKEDYIRYGGLDEHDSYRGYICGPYDLAVRMVNGGLREHWHHEEFLLHTYHPWIKPGLDRMGPHIRHNSTTSFKHLFDGDTRPYVENTLMRRARKQMFPNQPREGCPKFSVIVPQARPGFILRLYDSIKKATRLPFEVIFLGDEDYQAGEEHMTYLKSQGLYHSLIQGCRQAKGEIVVIVPPAALLRHNALDSLLDFQQKLIYPVVYLNALETFTQGFIWQYSSCKFISDHEVSMMTAFNTELLSEDQTELDLRRIFAEGKKIRSVFETPVHLELWHDDLGLYDEQLERLLIEMLELKSALSALFHGVKETAPERAEQINATEKAEAAEHLLDRIDTVEKNAPGKFLKYCFLKRYGLREYYDFVILLQQFNLSLTIMGLELLVSACSILTRDINENIKEFAWLYRFIYSDIAFIMGSAHFDLAVEEWKRDDLQQALMNLQLCLQYTPGHYEAKHLMKRIQGAPA